MSKTAGTLSPTFQRMRMNKTSGTVTLTNDVNVGVTATFTSGVMITTTGSHLNFNDNATATAANDLSYIDGPVRKTGNDIFTFPTGAANFYRPVGISAPGNVNDHFTAQYFNTAQPFGAKATWDPLFYTVSGCEYWILNRTNGTSNVTVTLSWNQSACTGTPFITDPNDLRVTRWTGAAWVNHGNGGTTGTNANGTIVTAGNVTAFSPFTLASTTIDNPLPIELENFWAVNNDNSVTLNWITLSQINNDHFTLQRSQDGFDFETIHTVEGAGTNYERLQYSHDDDGPYSGHSYYKLIQTDYDGNTKSWIIGVNRDGGDLPLKITPNPAGNEVVRFNQKVTVVIINSLDQVVGRYEGVTGIDVSGLASGVYVVRDQKGRITRLVKK